MANSSTRTRVALNERSGSGIYWPSSSAVSRIDVTLIGGGGGGSGPALSEVSNFILTLHSSKAGGGGGSGGRDVFHVDNPSPYVWVVGGGGQNESTYGDPGGIGPQSNGGEGQGGGDTTFTPYNAPGDTHTASGGRGGGSTWATGGTANGGGGGGDGGSPNGVSGGSGESGTVTCNGGSGGQLSNTTVGRGGNGGSIIGDKYNREEGKKGENGQVYVVETITIHEIVLSTPNNGTLSYDSTPVTGNYFDAYHQYKIKAKANNRFRIKSIVVKNNNGVTRGSYEPNLSTDGIVTEYTYTLPSLNEPFTVYAEFVQYDFDITYNYNAPTGTTQSTEPGPFTYSNGTGVSTALGSPTREWCTFKGWYDNAGLTGTPVTSIPANATGNKEFWAKWEGKTNTIIYEYNTASAGSTIHGNTTQTVTIQYNPSTGIVNTTLPSPDTDGGVYRFYGWYESSDFSTQRLTGGSPYYGGYNNSATRLYARWYTCSTTLHPDLKGGHGSENQTVNVRPGTSTTFTIWQTDPERDQYKFQLWAEQPDGTGAQYEAGDTITVSAPVDAFSVTKTLYAIWDELYDVIIHFYPNGGHWDDDSTEPKTYHTSSTTAAKSINVFTVSDSHSGDDQNPTNELEEGGQTYPLDFLGWANVATDRVPDYIYGTSETYSVSSASDYPSTRIIEFDLYAVWSGIVDISFTGKITENPPTGYPVIGGDVIIAADNIFMAFNYALEHTNPSGRLRRVPISIANKYVFNGWWTDPLLGTKVITDEATVVPDAISDKMVGDRFTDDVDLYAQWVPIHYVTFNTNGIPSISDTILTTNKDQKLTAFPELTDIQNYFITGWYDNPAGTGSAVTLDKVYTSDTTLYAKWVACYIITFDANGGSTESGQIHRERTNATYQITTYPTAVRPGYTLDTKNGTSTGWFYADNPSIPVQTGTMYLSDRTLIAGWIPKDYTITFDANGGKFEGDASTVQWTEVTFGQPYNIIPNSSSTREFPIPVTPPDNGRYTFQGYSFGIYSPGSSDAIPDVTASSIFNDERTTLFAVWRAGNHAITFNAMGGSVVPPRSITDMDGVLAYYPIPTRTGYVFTGWFLWPIYSTSERITDDNVMEAYRNISGRQTPEKNTVLVSTYGSTIQQYQYNGSVWNDVTGYLFMTYYIETDMPERQDPEHPDEPYLLDDNDQSDYLTQVWQSSQEYAGWTLYEGSGTPTVTFGTYDNLTDVIMSGITPRNNDVAKAGSLYFQFNIPFGLTYVLVRTDEHYDAAYTWVEDDTVIVDDFVIGGKWVNTTTDDMTVILPFKSFGEDTEVFAHWKEAPAPSTLSNTCYIERRLSKYGDDSIRLYLPTVTSIDDVITANLVQKDTLMFGYENKFLSDLGTSRRIAVTVERPNPMPYDDLSGDPSDWSNGKWYKAFLDFTDYWQNYGKDPVTGSMVGGFRFCYTPMAHSDEDDRVEYSDLYPVLEKNVFLVGNTDVSFSDTVLRFTMNLAVGQMTSDANSIGYRVRFHDDYPNNENIDVETVTPRGVDYQVLERPTDWKIPDGMMFSGWVWTDNVSGTGQRIYYSPGDIIEYTFIVKEGEEKQRDFTLTPVWVEMHACSMMTLDFDAEQITSGASSAGVGVIPYVMSILGAFANNGQATPAIVSRSSSVGAVGSGDSDIMTAPVYLGNGEYRVEFKADATIEMILIGGGGGGAGGQHWTVNIESDNLLVDLAYKMFKKYTANYIIAEFMGSGGAGGSGEMKTVVTNVSAGDVMTCKIGSPGGINYNSNLLARDGGMYLSGSNGGNTEFTLTYANSYKEPYPDYAYGGAGGSNGGRGGQSYMKGGNGRIESGSGPTRGETASVAPKGERGYTGADYNGGNEIAGARTYWYGGAGGGAAPLNHLFMVGSSVLQGGNGADGHFISVGGNGAGDKKDATAGKFGGGGGSGCGGYKYNIPGVVDDVVDGLPIVTNWHIPNIGGFGAIFIQAVRK